MGENNDVKACRLCLACDVKMHLIDSGLENLLKTILGQNITYTSGLPKYACYECAAFLKKFKQFKNKCLTAQTVLFSLLKLLKVVTLKDIIKLDRNKISLQSNLSLTKPDIHSCIEEGKNELDEYDSEPIGTSVYFDEEYLEDDVIKNKDNIDTNVEMRVDLLRIGITDMGLLSGGDYGSDQEDDMSLLQIAEIKEQKNAEYKTVLAEKKGYTTKRGRKVKPTTKGFCRKTNAGQSADQLMQVKKENDTNFWDLADDFTINILSLEEQKAALEQRKNRDAYKESKYKCEFCYTGFTTQLKYLNHITCHNPVLELECVVCHSRFAAAAALARHGAAHARAYSCNRCSYATTDILEAKLHRKHHEAVSESGDGSMIKQMDGEPLPAVICNLCGRPFTSTRALMFHKGKAHRRKPRKKSTPPPSVDNDVSKAEVSDTDATGPEADNLDRGSSVVASKLFCKKCNIQFTTKAAWKKHSHKTKRSKGRRLREYNPENMAMAVQAVQRGMKMSLAATTFKVPRSTLVNRMEKRLSGVEVSHGNMPIITADEEKELAQWIMDTEPKKVMLEAQLKVKAMLKNDVRANKFKNGVPGRRWFILFQKRHPELTRWLQLRKAKNSN